MTCAPLLDQRIQAGQPARHRLKPALQKRRAHLPPMLETIGGVAHVVFCARSRGGALFGGQGLALACRAMARARGRKGGRKPLAAHDPRVQTAKKMYAGKSLPIVDICKTLRISRATFYRYLAVS